MVQAEVLLGPGAECTALFLFPEEMMADQCAEAKVATADPRPSGLWRPLEQAGCCYKSPIPAGEPFTFGIKMDAEPRLHELKATLSSLLRFSYVIDDLLHNDLHEVEAQWVQAKGISEGNRRLSSVQHSCTDKQFLEVNDKLEECLIRNLQQVNECMNDVANSVIEGQAELWKQEITEEARVDDHISIPSFDNTSSMFALVDSCLSFTLETKVAATNLLSAASDRQAAICLLKFGECLAECSLELRFLRVEAAALNPLYISSGPNSPPEVYALCSKRRN